MFNRLYGISAYGSISVVTIYIKAVKRVSGVSMNKLRARDNSNF